MIAPDDPERRQNFPEFGVLGFDLPDFTSQSREKGSAREVCQVSDLSAPILSAGWVRQSCQRAIGEGMKRSLPCVQTRGS